MVWDHTFLICGRILTNDTSNYIYDFWRLRIWQCPNPILRTFRVICKGSCWLFGPIIDFFLYSLWQCYIGREYSSILRSLYAEMEILRPFYFIIIDVKASVPLWCSAVACWRRWARSAAAGGTPNPPRWRRGTSCRSPGGVLPRAARWLRPRGAWRELRGRGTSRPGGTRGRTQGERLPSLWNVTMNGIIRNKYYKRPAVGMNGLLREKS